MDSPCTDIRRHLQLKLMLEHRMCAGLRVRALLRVLRRPAAAARRRLRQLLGTSAEDSGGLGESLSGAGSGHALEVHGSHAVAQLSRAWRTGIRGKPGDLWVSKWVHIHRWGAEGSEGRTVTRGA